MQENKTKLVVVVSAVTRNRCSDDTQRARSEVWSKTRSFTSDTVHGFSVAVDPTRELPLSFTFRRNRVLPFVLVASHFSSHYVPVRSALVLRAVFPIGMKWKSRCHRDIAVLSVSSVRLLPV